MICANTPLLLPKFLSSNDFILITKNKLNEPCLSPYALLALPRINLHTLYSLHSFYFLWTIIFTGTPCYLSNWLMWYDWMNGTMLFLAKYLEFVFKKKSSIACLLKLMKIPTKAKVRFSCSNLHMQFDFALSFVKILWPLLETCHTLMIKITYTSTHMLCFYTGR